MERVYSIQYICLLMATAALFITGLLIHLFIVAVNIIDCWKRRPMTPADQIIFSVGFSRLIFQVSCLGDMSCTIILQSALRKMLIQVQVAMQILTMLSNYCSLWFSTLLSIVFCLKISNSTNVSFLRLKSFILRKVVHLIVTSLLLSGLYTAVGSWLYQDEVYSLGVKIKMNITQNIQLSQTMEIFYIIGNVAPFTFNCISTILVLKNLSLHLSRMRGSNTNRAHLDTYYTAIKSTASCFVSYTLHIISTLILMNYLFLIDIEIFYFIANLFPAVHSAYLIYVTTRLRNQFSRLVYHGRKCLLNRETCDQMENQNCPGMQEPPGCNENIPMS